MIYVWDSSAIIPANNNSNNNSNSNNNNNNNNNSNNNNNNSKNNDTENEVHPLLSLVGHSDVVCALGATHDGDVISGSWDKTARVWRGGECIQELKGHEQAVWAVLGLPNGDIITASADRTVKIWRGPPSQLECVSTLEKHSDCVRGLALVPGVGFVSCGNDGVVILWSFTGEVLQELHGHTAFVYSVAVLPDSRIVSCGEDRSVRVWENGECVQTITHPAGVWCVSALPNGDVVSGGSDGVARVWTRNPARVADAAAAAAYEKSLAATAIHKQSVGDLQMDKLPSADALAMPGKKDGENKIIRVGNGAEAYSWSAGEEKWVKIGEVVDAASSGKQELYGKEYDYVFEIDVNGEDSKKIGYNNGENPYEVAQHFLWREDLDQGFLDQVAQFIIKNTQNAPMVLGAAGAGDPLTGGNRYVPGSRPATQPTTSSSTPKTTPTPAPAPTSTYTSASSLPPSKHYPQRQMVFFTSQNLAGLVSKIEEFSGKFPPATELAEEHRKALTSLVAILKETSRYHATTFTEEHYQLMVKLLSWPQECLLPVLDLLRILFLHPHSAEILSSPPRTYRGKLLDITKFLTDDVIAAKSNPTNAMLALRAVSNMFSSMYARTQLEAHQQRIVQLAGQCAKEDNKNMQAAATTILLNFAVGYHLKKSSVNEAKAQCLYILCELAKDPIVQKEPESMHRVLVAIGTCVWEDTTMLSVARSLDIKSTVAKIASGGGSENVTSCAKDLSAAL